MTMEARMEDGYPLAAKRLNIQDIAAAAGVSTASVSYALNGKPGVSEATRARILAVAREFSWEPNRQAQALHSSRTDVVGFVVPAANAALSVEAFWIQFISGLERELRLHGKSLLLHTEERLEVELDIYRRWKSRGIVDAVVLTDLRQGDERVPLLKSIGLPAVLAGKPDPDLGLSYAYANDTFDMDLLLNFLVGLGLRRFARIAGDPSYLFVGERDEAIRTFAVEHGLPEPMVAHSGFYSDDSVLTAVRRFLASPEPPEVIVADSDLLALHTMQALHTEGVRVPDEIQVVSFDDAALCGLVSPTITALERRPHELGRAAGRLLVEVGDAQKRVSRIPAAEIHARETTRSVAKG